MRRKTEDWDPKEDNLRKSDSEELGLEELELEQEEGGRSGWEGEPGGMSVRKGTVIAIFCGLVVLAAIICGILWYLTHGGRGGDSGTSSAGTEGTSIAEVSRDPEGADSAQGSGEGNGLSQDPEGAGFSQGSGEGNGSSQDPEGAGSSQGSGEGNGSSQDPEGAGSSQGSGEGNSSSQGSEGTGAGSSQGSGEGSSSSSQGSEGTGAGSSQGSGEGNSSSQGSEGTGAGSSQGSGEGSSSSSQGSEGAGTSSSQGSSEGSGSPSREPENGSSSVSSDPNRVSTLDGRVIVFTDCDDIVTPKIYVNLRTEPSTSEGETTVYEQEVISGTRLHRTGISEDSGWSRVERDGTVCYVVTSYVVVMETEEQ